ncbi:putative ZCF37 [Quillaja saponaria]|uniref:ZCF37 n=1 Tax=Quillaja saponaria TaxID=32244 RepID=A0AAD7VIB4_QUISA|nr:putative ZCF37 [Quillaja saponaria]
MLSPFMICGTIHHEDEDEDELCNTSPGCTPRKSRRNNKNPYSKRGIDKFSALLADLEEKRQKIYSQIGSQDISFIRFVYSNSNDFVPVVVKLKHKDEQNNKSTEVKIKQLTQISEVINKSPMESSNTMNETNQPNLEAAEKAEKKKSFSWNMIRLNKLRKPSYYLPLVVVLILVILAVFGRSAAILCTCIAWYLVPMPKDSSRTRKSMKKKNYVRRVSEKKDYARRLSEKRVSDGLSSQ